MKLKVNPNWLSVNVQAIVDPPYVILEIPEDLEELACDIIKVKMRRNPSSAGSKT